MKTNDISLIIEICSEDGSRAEFHQSGEDNMGKILRLMMTPRLFTSPVLTLSSERSVSTLPCRTIDLIKVRTPSTPPLLLPPGWLDSVEIGAEKFHEEADYNRTRDENEGAFSTEAGELTFFLEIHTIGDWMICLKIRTAVQATPKDQRQLAAHFFDLPVIPFRLETGGAGFINPTKITRVTVHPAFNEIAETELTANLVGCIRS
jgi:hypothetical protein